MAPASTFRRLEIRRGTKSGTIDQRSRDYSNIAEIFRPGHADFGYWEKYGIRDYRGGGRSSGRETIGRVAAGAVAAKVLGELGITFTTFTRSIGPVDAASVDVEQISENALYMPDNSAAAEAAAYLEECMRNKDSAGGVIECWIDGVPAGIGEPVFDKLDARLAGAVFSIGAVKGFEIDRILRHLRRQFHFYQAGVVVALPVNDDLIICLIAPLQKHCLNLGREYVDALDDHHIVASSHGLVHADMGPSAGAFLPGQVAQIDQRTV